MKEIDQMLNQWIHSSIIRAKLRELITKEINNMKKKCITVLDYETGAILRTISVDNALYNSSDASTAFVVTVEEQDEQDGALLESVDIYVSLRDLTGGTTVAVDKFVKSYDASAFTKTPTRVI
mgnify:CR=1 FL=1